MGNSWHNAGSATLIWIHKEHGLMSSHHHPENTSEKVGLPPAMLALLLVGAGVIAFLTFVAIHATKETPNNPIEMMR